MDGDLCVVIPTYGQFDYAAAALESLFDTTPRAWACVVDDASPGWEAGRSEWIAPLEVAHPGRLLVIPYSENAGLTRSWNRGLEEARRHGAAYTCCTNSDVLFPADWEAPLIEVLDTSDFALLGPLSNAPGSTARGLQEVWKYAHDYRVSDERQKLDHVSAELRRLHAHAVVHSPVNGFCMMARTERWWNGAFDPEHVFDPSPRYRMAGNEEELQRRWRALGFRSAVVPASFVFHYRAVTRGDRYKRGRWLRRRGAVSALSSGRRRAAGAAGTFTEKWYSDRQLEALVASYRLVADVPGRVIEIGCWEGRSTVALARACFPKNLIAVDSWRGSSDESPEHVTVLLAKKRDVYRTFLDNVEKLTAGNVVPQNSDWRSYFVEDPPEPIAFCHIDAAHDYVSVRDTILALLPRLSRGGMLCGDDFKTAHAGRADLKGGVERAVRELLPGFSARGNLWQYRA